MFGGVVGYRPRVRTAYYERVYTHSPEGHLINSRCDAAFQEAASQVHRQGDHGHNQFGRKEDPFQARAFVQNQ